MSRPVCECDTIPTGSPSRYDRFREGEERVPNPVCSIHRHIDGEHMTHMDYDTDHCLEHYGVAWSYDRAEWVECEAVEPDTGEPL